MWLHGSHAMIVTIYIPKCHFENLNSRFVLPKAGWANHSYFINSRNYLISTHTKVSMKQFRRESDLFSLLSATFGADGIGLPFFRAVAKPEHSILYNFAYDITKFQVFHECTKFQKNMHSEQVATQCFDPFVYSFVGKCGPEVFQLPNGCC